MRTSPVGSVTAVIAVRGFDVLLLLVQVLLLGGVPDCTVLLHHQCLLQW